MYYNYYIHISVVYIKDEHRDFLESLITQLVLISFLITLLIIYITKF